MGRMGPTHGRKPKNSKKGRREAPIFENGHLKGAVGPIRPWALANLVTALGAHISPLIGFNDTIKVDQSTHKQQSLPFLFS